MSKLKSEKKRNKFISLFKEGDKQINKHWRTKRPDILRALYNQEVSQVISGQFSDDRKMRFVDANFFSK